MSADRAAQMSRPDPSLSLYQLLRPEVLANPYPLYARLRNEDPVHWDPFLHAWVVTSYDDVLEVWRTSCPRLPVWEEARDRGYVARCREPGQGQLLTVSPSGAEHLRRHRSTVPA